MISPYMGKFKNSFKKSKILLEKAKNYIKEMEVATKNRVAAHKEIHSHGAGHHSHQTHGHGILHLHHHNNQQQQQHQPEHQEKYKEIQCEDLPVESMLTKPVVLTVGTLSVKLNV